MSQLLMTVTMLMIMIKDNMTIIQCIHASAGNINYNHAAKKTKYIFLIYVNSTLSLHVFKSTETQ